MIVTTSNGEMDTETLQRREGLVDDANECTTWIEYCMADCEGQSHKSGMPDAREHFCRYNVHRSVNMILKKAPTLDGLVMPLGT